MILAAPLRRLDECEDQCRLALTPPFSFSAVQRLSVECLTAPANLMGVQRMIFDDMALARAIHVLSLVHWIGGVAIVTTIVLPRARKSLDAGTAISEFEAFEQRFAFQARISIALAGLSGTYLLMALDGWARFKLISYWWLDLMVAVWFAFAVMIYVLEPLLVHRVFHEFALRDKERAFAIAIRLHAIALLVGAVAIGAGVMGAHGGLP
jgi:uncharacterized membrane protein